MYPMKEEARMGFGATACQSRVHTVCEVIYIGWANYMSSRSFLMEQRLQWNLNRKYVLKNSIERLRKKEKKKKRNLAASKRTE